MLEHGEAREEHVVLRTEAQGVPGLGHVAPDVVAVDLRVPGGRGEQPGQHGHRGGLPRPVVAQQGGDLPLEGVEGHAVHRHHLLATAKHLSEAADLHTAGLRRLVLKQRLVMKQRGSLVRRHFCRVSAPVGFLF